MSDPMSDPKPYNKSIFGNTPPNVPLPQPAPTPAPPLARPQPIVAPNPVQSNPNVQAAQIVPPPAVNVQPTPQPVAHTPYQPAVQPVYTPPPAPPQQQQVQVNQPALPQPVPPQVPLPQTPTPQVAQQVAQHPTQRTPASAGEVIAAYGIGVGFWGGVLIPIIILLVYLFFVLFLHEGVDLTWLWFILGMGVLPVVTGFVAAWDDDAEHKRIRIGSLAGFVEGITFGIVLIILRILFILVIHVDVFSSFNTIGDFILSIVLFALLTLPIGFISACIATILRSPPGLNGDDWAYTIWSGVIAGVIALGLGRVIVQIIPDPNLNFLLPILLAGIASWVASGIAASEVLLERAGVISGFITIMTFGIGVIIAGIFDILNTWGHIPPSDIGGVFLIFLFIALADMLPSLIAAWLATR